MFLTRMIAFSHLFACKIIVPLIFLVLFFFVWDIRESGLVGAMSVGPLIVSMAGCHISLDELLRLLMGRGSIFRKQAAEIYLASMFLLLLAAVFVAFVSWNLTLPLSHHLRSADILSGLAFALSASGIIGVLHFFFLYREAKKQ